MGKVLSQEEIDALLNDAKRGKDIDDLGGEKQVVEYLYDWKNPAKINTEHRRRLRQIFQIFATSFSTFLQTTLKTMVDIELVDISTVSYSDYILSVSEPTCMYKVYLDKLKSHGTIEVQPAFVFYLVERLLGGNGSQTDLTRPVSPIEESIMLKIMQSMFVSLKDGWRSNIPGLNFSFNGFETNPNFVSIAPSNDIVGLFAFQVSIKDESFSFTICFPSSILDQILARLSTSNFKTQSKVSKNNINIIEDYVKFTEVMVVAELGTTEISIEEFQNLKIGDVLTLDKIVDDPIVMKVDDKPKFLVKPGVEGNHKAIEFIRTLTPEEERKYETRRFFRR